MEGYNINTNFFNYGNYDPEIYNFYQPPFNLDPFGTRSSSVSSYQTPATPNSVDDLSEQSHLEQTFSPVSQATSNDETQTHETQWTQPLLNSHYHGYYPHGTTTIAPYIRGYAPHWAAMGNFLMDNPWYRYNQTYFPVNIQQEDETSSETTWPDNSSNSTIFEGVIKEEKINSCSENLTEGLELERPPPQSVELLTNLRAELLRSPPSRSSSSDVVMPEPKNENYNGNGQVNVPRRRKGKIVFSFEQRAVLEKEFAEGNRYLTKTKRILLAKQLKLDERHITVWFQNRRVKEKRREKDILNSIQNSKVDSTPQGNANNDSCTNTILSYEIKINQSVDDTEDKPCDL